MYKNSYEEFNFKTIKHFNNFLFKQERKPGQIIQTTLQKVGV